MRNGIRFRTIAMKFSSYLALERQGHGECPTIAPATRLDALHVHPWFERITDVDVESQESG